MDDMNAFDRQIANEVRYQAGPSRSVDVLGIIRSTTTQSSKWRFQSMLSATKFVVAGAIVALFGGFLLSGVLTQPSTESVPAATTSGPGTFSPVGSLNERRKGHTATLLPDGRVLVVGGTSTANERLAPAEVWDPATASFEPAGSIAEGGEGLTSTLLPDGRVLVVGNGVSGFPKGWPDESPAEAEIWDPATASFSPTGSQSGRTFHTATGLPDGRVLLAGGHYWDEDLDEGRESFDAPTEIWGPATASFSPAGSLAQARYAHTATLLPDGRVLVVGGSTPTGGGGTTLSSAEVWDPVAATFSPSGSLSVAREGHTATLLQDGRVLVVSGTDYEGGRTDNSGEPTTSPTAEVWDPVTAAFSPAGSLSVARYLHTATLLPDGRVLVVGGTNHNSWGSAEVWDPVTASFEPAASLAGAHFNHTATLLPDGRVLVVGGDYGGGSVAEVWNP